jgi:hypothetical protein
VPNIARALGLQPGQGLGPRSTTATGDADPALVILRQFL